MSKIRIRVFDAHRYPPVDLDIEEAKVDDEIRELLGSDPDYILADKTAGLYFAVPEGRSEFALTFMKTKEITGTFVLVALTPRSFRTLTEADKERVWTLE